MKQNNYDQGGSTVLSNKNTKNANFLFIVDMLKDLLAQELITEKEYARAKKYYMKLTGADIVLAHWKLCIRSILRCSNCFDSYSEELSV